ncbi:hypothetical protein BG004_002453, partial [Podila humilis]
MLCSFPTLLGAIALTITSAPYLAHAQFGTGGVCGGQLVSGSGTYYDVVQTPTLTYLTMKNILPTYNQTESYVLYCTDFPPESNALIAIGAPANAEMFKLPLGNVMVDDTFTSSYIELIGLGNNITILSNPQNIVSPCLQQRVSTGSITAVDSANYAAQYESISAAFRYVQDPGQKKDIWMPHTIDIEPLARLENLKAVSLFFNAGLKGEEVYNQIKSAYETHKNNMAGIPQANKKRIAWVRYNLELKRWQLRNSRLTRAIIQDAGGIPFPLSGNVEADDIFITAPNMKILVLNAHVLIDQTEYPSGTNRLKSFRETSGFTETEAIPILANWKYFSLDYTTSATGSNDYNYRGAARPDLLLQDMIRAQYESYQPALGPNFNFLRKNVAGEGGISLSAADCTPTAYNAAPITIVASGAFTAYDAPPAPPTGGGVFGSDGSGSEDGENKPQSKTGIIVGVIVAAVVLGAGFAFAFF